MAANGLQLHGVEAGRGGGGRGGWGCVLEAVRMGLRSEMHGIAIPPTPEPVLLSYYNSCIYIK